MGTKRSLEDPCGEKFLSDLEVKSCWTSMLQIKLFNNLFSVLRLVHLVSKIVLAASKPPKLWTCSCCRWDMIITEVGSLDKLGGYAKMQISDVISTECVSFDFWFLWNLPCSKVWSHFFRKAWKFFILIIVVQINGWSPLANYLCSSSHYSMHINLWVISCNLVQVYCWKGLRFSARQDLDGFSRVWLVVNEDLFNVRFGLCQLNETYGNIIAVYWPWYWRSCATRTFAASCPVQIRR